MVGHGGCSAGSSLADPTSSIPSHCALIVATSTLRVKTTWKHMQLTVWNVYGLTKHTCIVNSLILATGWRGTFFDRVRMTNINSTPTCGHITFRHYAIKVTPVHIRHALLTVIGIRLTARIDTFGTVICAIYGMVYPYVSGFETIEWKCWALYFNKLMWVDSTSMFFMSCK